MDDIRYPPTQVDYYALVQQARWDRHRRSALGEGRPSFTMQDDD